ncbi:30S ribosomal protein S12 methylthiotransferase RimO [Mariniblastus sp.]|nr:30S ribosomal protein S12 methylthiotransferase RimO [Mariniblastus sp.]
MATEFKKLPDTADYKGSYAFISLGCPKNTVDSERMMGLLKIDGYQLVADPVGSDFVVVNTCGFIEEARTESFGAIDEMLELKKAGKTKGVIVSGCLAERQKEQLLEDRPEIDSLVGVFGRESITDVADRLVGDLEEQRSVFQPAPIRALPDQDRLQITPKHFAYLKISEGCDRLCTFCAIPKMRGKHATKPMEEVIAEAQQLADSGVRELIIVAQDTTYYGMDMYGEPRLAELLEKLNAVEGLDWIRLMYFYPMYIDDKLLNTIAACDKIVPYIDMPLQHADNVMLKRMSRRVNFEQTEAQIVRMRELLPKLVLRTTFIVGFPGETEEQFQVLVDFTKRHKFERMGVFTYSFEPDTPAARMEGHLEEDIKNERRDRLMAVQQQVMFEYNESQIGKTIDVIIDQPVAEQPGAWIGRSEGDAPDVDGAVFVTQTEDELQQGDIVPCEVVTFRDYDLIAVAVGAPSRKTVSKAAGLPVI